MSATAMRGARVRRDMIVPSRSHRGVFRVAAIATAGAFLVSCSNPSCCDPVEVPECILTITAATPSVTIEVFQTATVSATGTKSATCGTVKRLWSSTNPGVVAVSGQGVVTGVAVGATTVRATDRDETYGTTAFTDIQVSVVAPITVNITSAPSAIDLGASQQLTASVTGAASQAVTWTSSASAVVSVTTGGLATAMGSGTATLTATSTASPTKSASINVNVSVQVGVSPGPVSLDIGGTQQFTAVVTGAQDKGVTWATSNSAVLSINSTSGLATAVSTGSATVTATSVAAPSRTGTAAVTVTVPPLLLRNRWTFSETGGAGTQLVDDVGGAHGTIVAAGNNPGMVQSGEVVLTGGARDISDYVSLPGGLLSGFASATIEVWATLRSIQWWGRIFDFGSSPTNYLLMSWNIADFPGTDRVEWKGNGGTFTLDNSAGPYTVGQEYQVVMTIEEGAGTGGSTVVTLYRNGQPRGSFETPLTLGDLVDTNMWLGRSHYAPDMTANASYNELRIYSGAMSAADVAARFAAGPVDDRPSLSVTSVSPADGTTNLSIETAFEVTFSTNVDPATVTPANVSLTQAGAPVPLSVTVNGPVVTITPTSLLGENAPVALSVSTGVRGTGAKALAAAYNASFAVALFDPNYTYRFFNNLTGQAKSLDTHSGTFDGFMGDTDAYSGQFWYLTARPNRPGFYLMRNLFKGDDWYLEGTNGVSPVELQNTAPTVFTGQEWQFVFNGFGPGCFYIRNVNFGATKSMENVGGAVIMQPTAATGGQCWSIARIARR